MNILKELVRWALLHALTSLSWFHRLPIEMQCAQHPHHTRSSHNADILQSTLQHHSCCKIKFLPLSFVLILQS